MNFYKKIDLEIDLLIEKYISGLKKTGNNMNKPGKIVKSAENANLLGIPSNPVAYQPRGSLCYEI